MLSSTVDITGFLRIRSIEIEKCLYCGSGAGGLAGSLLRYLCGMGFGRIIIFDDDCVDHSNLQRQIMFDTYDLGLPKAERAKMKLQVQNPLITVEAMNYRFDEQSAQGIMPDVDLIIDACDNFETRYAIEKISQAYQVPWIYSSIFEFKGQLAVFNYKTGFQYSDLFPEPPETKPSSKNGEIAIMPSLPGVMGSLQASEAFKIITGKGEILDGYLLLYDSLTTEIQKLSFV